MEGGAGLADCAIIRMKQMQGNLCACAVLRANVELPQGGLELLSVCSCVAKALFVLVLFAVVPCLALASSSRLQASMATPETADDEPVSVFTPEQQDWIERLIAARAPVQPSTVTPVTVEGTTSTSGTAPIPTLPPTQSATHSATSNPGNLGERTSTIESYSHVSR